MARKSNKASLDCLEQLHQLVGASLLEALATDPSPATIKLAIDFLHKNKIEVDMVDANPIAELSKTILEAQKKEIEEAEKEAEGDGRELRAQFSSLHKAE